MSRRSAVVTLAAALLVGVGLPQPLVHAAPASSITGRAFQDLDRDRVADAGEPVLAGTQIFLVRADGSDVGNTVTDAYGDYRFTGLPAGAYEVQYDVVAWWGIRSEWVVDGAVIPRVAVSLAEGQALTADFTWRRIVSSAELDRPLSTYTGPEGLQVDSYNDAVEASEVYRTMTQALIQAEAPRVVIRFGFGSTSDAATSVSTGPDGRYEGYRAAVNVAWLSWLDRGDETLTHEYGHAWSLYYAYEVQQDTTMTSYLRARGLDADPRVNTAYEWSVRELIADDYRQLFGSPNARSGSPLNRQIPHATAVPGLASFLRDGFTAPPAGAPAAAALALTGPAASPQVVKSSTDITVGVSKPADAVVTVRDGSGAVVRTLFTGSVSASLSVRWDRTNDKGRRVRAGTYSVDVSATDGLSTVTGSTPVKV